MKSFNDIWKDVNLIEGWLNYPVVKLLYNKSRVLQSHQNIVEIGSWKGRSTVLFGLSSQANIYAIDPHTGSSEHRGLVEEIDTYNEFKENLLKHNLLDKINIYKDYSANVSKKFHEGIDLLWIDGSHEYADVKLDFECWFPKLNYGGVILFHDSKWPGVKKLLWEQLYHSREVGIIRRIEDTTYAIKCERNTFLVYFINLAILKKYQFLQLIKRYRRKIRKSVKRRFKK